jgi:cardiolipin synthase A/B
MKFYWIFSHLAVILGFLLAALVIAHVIRQQRSPAGTIAWLLVVVLVPYIGVPLYLMFGGRKIRRSASRKANITLPAGSTLCFERSTLIDRLLRSYGIPGATANNRVSLCQTGEERYAAMVKLIEEATRSIWITMFILDPDKVGKEFINRLTRRAVEGLDVRLLLDSVGSLHTTRRFLSPVVEAGGQISFFMPLLHRPFRGRTNLRNHRKIIIADEQRVIAGGANIAGIYVDQVTKSNQWQDLSFILEGPAVIHYTEVFRLDWEFASGQRFDLHPELAQPVPGSEDSAIVQVVPSGPDMAGDPLYDAILSAIFTAKQCLWVVTPYFIPDNALVQALNLASRRGVDVHILVPEKSNYPIIDLARSAYLRELQANGCTIQLYSGGMMHAKVFLVDKQLAMIGSPNMDMRSLFLNYEIAMFAYSRPEIQATKVWLEELAENSRIGVKEVGAFRDICEGIARMMSPLL